MVEKAYRFLKVFLTIILISGAFTLPAMAGDEDRNNSTSDAEICWPTPEADWYEAYQYTKDADNHILYLKRYKRGNTAEYIVVPSAVTIGTDEYMVMLDSDPVVESSEPYDTNSLWGPGAGSLKGIKISDGVKTKSCKQLFHNMAHLETLDVSGLDTMGVTDMSYMFQGCTALESLNIGGLNTAVVDDMSGMFQNCEKLTVIGFGSGFVTKNVTDMNSMFEGCDKLTKLDLSGLDTSNVEDMGSMFENCKKLRHIHFGENFRTEKVIGMRSMYCNCTMLEELDLSTFNTSNVRDMQDMFLGCGNLLELDVSAFDTSNCENMESMFEDCVLLRSLNVSHFDTSKVKNMKSMFSGLLRLDSLDLGSFNTGNVTDFYQLVHNCKALKVLDLRSFDFSNGKLVYESAYSFMGDSGIVYLYLPVKAMSGSDFAEDYRSENCKLTDVYYAGTEEQWQALGNTLPEGTILHCEFDGEATELPKDEKPLITSLSWSKESVEFKRGSCEWVSYSIEPTEGLSDAKIRNTSTDPSVAYLDDSGIVALSPGTTTITLWTVDGSDLKADLVVNVVAEDKKLVTTITLDKGTLELKKGSSEKLIATVEPEDAADKTLLWESENPDIADVDQNGIVMAKNTGSTYIICKANDGGGALTKCSVTVVNDNESGPFDPSELIIGSSEATDPQPVLENTANQSLMLIKGQKFLLPYKDWSSSNKKVAAVSKGVVTAKADGTATLTRGSGEMAQTIHITVMALTLDKKEKKHSLIAGEVLQLTLAGKTASDGMIAFSKKDSLPIRFVSSAPDVANVSQDGIVSAMSKGSAVVTAYINGVAFKYSVKVMDAGKIKLKFTESAEGKTTAVTLAPMQSVTMKTNGFIATGATWTSERDDIVAKDELGKNIVYEDGVVRITYSGKITAIGSGTTIIKAYSGLPNDSIPIPPLPPPMFSNSDSNTEGRRPYIIVITVNDPIKKTIHLNINGSKPIKLYGVKKKLTWKDVPEEDGEERSHTTVINNKIIAGGVVGSAEFIANYEHFTYTLRVVVENPALVTDNTLTGKETSYKLTLNAGDTYKISYIAAKPEWIVFTGKKSSVAYMDAEGVIHARSKGKAKLTAKVNGKTVSIKVTVK